MKRAILMAACAVACLSLSACAGGGSVQKIDIRVDAATADAAAVKFEVAVAVFADTMAFAAADPNSGLDLQRLAVNVDRAAAYLDQGRTAFDARTNDVTQLVTQALDAVSMGLPVAASPKVRAALLAARLAVGLYGAAIGSAPGAAVPPSDTLVASRKAADQAIERLRTTLSPPGS